MVLAATLTLEGPTPNQSQEWLARVGQGQDAARVPAMDFKSVVRRLALEDQEE